MRSRRAIAANSRSTARPRSSRRYGSWRWSSEGFRKRAASSGSARPRSTRTRATTGSMPRAAASAAAAASSASWCSQINARTAGPPGRGYRASPSTTKSGPQLPHLAELGVAAVEPLRPRQDGDLAQRARERRVEQRRRGGGVGVGAADRLRDDLVDDVHAEQVRRGDLERLGGLDLAPGVAPQDGRAALGRDDAVDRVLLHQHAVADGDAERAAAAALPRHDDDDRHVEHRHLAQVVGDGLGDAALLRLDARVGRRRVHEDDDRPPELLGEAHHADRLAVALRAGVAEVAVDLLLGVAPLLVPHHAHRLAVVVGKAGHDGVVVAEAAVAVHLDEIGEQQADVVEHVRPGGVPRHLHALPGRQGPVDLAPDRLDAAAEALDLPIALGRGRHQLEGLDLLLQDADRLFEFKQFGHRPLRPAVSRQRSVDQQEPPVETAA